MNIQPKEEHQPASNKSSSPSSSNNLPASTEHQPINIPPTPEQSPNPYAHLSPPFEKFWDINAPLPPACPTIPEPSPAHAFLTGNETLYFAYGKDMDLTYLIKKFGPSSEEDIKFIAVGKLSGFRWIFGSELRFPKIIPAEQDIVYGLIYQIPDRGLDILKQKAEKRGLRIEEKNAEMLEKLGLPGFWNAPLGEVGSANVQVMVGEWRVEDEMEVGEKRVLEGSKKRKVNGGILWAASEGLPEGWKESVLRKWVEAPKGPEESGYWGARSNDGKKEESVSKKLKSKVAKKRKKKGRK
jgi:hypothetical protein